MPPLDEYRRKRDATRTPEPVPEGETPPTGENDIFVIQEHHARRLHWDVRLERDGVLVSWAVPRGLPAEPGTIRLAVRTEDHPMEYATFEGEIPNADFHAGGSGQGG
jgi:bifunctional non-homologous end joining protein LigD